MPSQFLERREAIVTVLVAAEEATRRIVELHVVLVLLEELHPSVGRSTQIRTVTPDSITSDSSSKDSKSKQTMT